MIATSSTMRFTRMQNRVGQFYSLARIYWGAHTSPFIWLLLILLFVLLACQTSVTYWWTDAQKDLIDAMTGRDLAGFKTALVLTFAVLFAGVVVSALDQVVQRTVEIDWRQGMTTHFVSRWMRGHVPYRIERDRKVDNADQRIADDTRMFCSSALHLGLSFVSTMASFCVFSVVLWRNSGTFEVHLGSFGTYVVQGYLFFVAIAWAVVQNGVTHLAGHKIAGYTVAQQRAEADFRFALAKSRENAEQVALYRGDAVERSRFGALFVPIRMNWRSLTVQNVRLTFASYSFNLLSSLVPFIAAAPRVMSGEMSVGTMMQSGTAFGMVLIGMTWFALVYGQLVVFSAVIQRLVGLDTATQAADPPGIEVTRSKDMELTTEQLALGLPDGSIIAVPGDLEIANGERVLLRGASGVGKSTLLRAIAGLWPFGHGRIALPGGARTMTLPQRSYIADGTLKEVVAYPLSADDVDDESCRRALIDSGLGHLVDRLKEHHRWGHLLSGGEQQRLAFARAFVFRPDILFMDEATSALDVPAEARLYTKLREQLPGCTILSVAHRESLASFHDRELELEAPPRTVPTT